MKLIRIEKIFAVLLVTGLSTSLPAMLQAQTDEIQVYDGEVAEPGIFNLMIHNNFTPIGRKTPDYPGAIIANNSYQVTAEWAYGVTPWFEQGLYLPVTSLYSENHGTTYNGMKIRELFARPNAKDHKFVYAANFEFSFNRPYWEATSVSSEIRLIAAVHVHQWDFIYNPIFDSDFKGGFKNMDFNPSVRVAYNVNDRWAVAAEEYAGFGTVSKFDPTDQQFHEIWGTVDYSGKKLKGFTVESGVGYGLTSASDKLTFKWMFAHDLNVHPWRLKK